MGRGAKPGKAKAEGKRPVVRGARKSNSSMVHDLEKRLAEAQKREAEAQKREAEAQKREAEALEQQTATSEILRVISRTPVDLQHVMDTIAEHAARLCEATDAQILRLDGGAFRLAASHGPLLPASLVPVTRGSVAGRAVIDRQTIHIRDIATEPSGEFPDSLAKGLGRRTVLVVPLLREGVPIGVVVIRRMEVRPFSDKQIELLQTFADQAVIAIENVRLFEELEARNRDLTAALEQQTATSEILGVISRSPTDIQPVFDVIVQSAVRLCGGLHSNVYLVGDGFIDLVAHHNFSPAALEDLRRRFPIPVNQAEGLAARVIREGIVVHLHDALTDPGVPETTRRITRALGARSVLYVPMRRDRVGIGAIVVSRADVKPFSDKEIALIKTFADQAVIAIENVRLFTELQERNHELTEALDQQTATSNVLKVISRSTFDLAAVLTTLIENAARLCGAHQGFIFRADGERYHLAADYNAPPAFREWAATTQIRPGDGRIVGRVAVEGRVVQIVDAQGDAAWRAGNAGAPGVGDVRALLGVPMLREGVLIGVFAMWRLEPRPFTDKQIELVTTFADQAVIAIENVRLFKELEGRNRDLTATSKILQVISRSPTDAQPVFDTIAERAMHLCDAAVGFVGMFDGALIHVRALANMSPEGVDAIHEAFPAPPSRGSAGGRVILTGDVVQIPDALEDPEYQLTGAARAVRFRGILGVPMVHQGRAVGVILVGRPEPGMFSEEQVQVLKTFADQAVIAIENVRLFTELDTSNRELTTALDTQTATSDILRVISRSQTDVQPVFDAIVASAVRLLGAYSGVLTRIAGEQIELAAITSTSDVGDAFLRARFPQTLSSAGPHARTIRDRAPLNITETHTDPRLPETVRANARVRGYRSQVVVPLLRHDEAIGTISLTRGEPGGFTIDEIGLLQSFADQAVIAIENARLFTELQARTSELTRSVGELTALGDVGRALSSTLDLGTVLQTIVTRANALAGTDGCAIYEYDEVAAVFRLRASRYTDPRDADTLDPIGRATPIPRGQGAAGQAAALGQPIQIADIAVAGAYESPIREPLVQAGYRAILTVPLLLEDQVIGAVSISRKTPGEFAPESVRLLTAFATQSALAIQNARLFHEIEDKSRQLEAASRHKSEFLANMSHELRTPLNAVIGFSEVLAERMFGDINEKQAEYLQDILESGRHLLSLINDILDLSKIEAGRMELEAADFDLPSAIDNALILVRERATRRGISLGCLIDEGLGTIRGDERKVKQVLLNLLSNALKFTPEGGRIDVRAGLHEGRAEVSVADTGVGIAPEDQAAVFEEFRQVGTADKKVEGTGLGLALSQKFVHLHGGRIWVESELGRGSTFTFTLPVS